jgi:hypothetical protein
VQQRLLAKQKLADGERSLLAEAAVSGLLYSGPSMMRRYLLRSTI